LFVWHFIQDERRHDGDAIVDMRDAGRTACCPFSGFTL
jgi:uncharacterized damage-inducible protein DinB